MFLLSCDEKPCLSTIQIPVHVEGKEVVISLSTAVGWTINLDGSATCPKH